MSVNQEKLNEFREALNNIIANESETLTLKNPLKAYVLGVVTATAYNDGRSYDDESVVASLQILDEVFPDDASALECNKKMWGNVK